MARDIPQEEIDERAQFEEDLAEEERGSVLDRLASEDPDLVFVKAHTRSKPKKRERLAVPEMAQEALEASVAPPGVAQPSPPPIPPGVTAPPGGGGVGGGGIASLLGKGAAVGGGAGVGLKAAEMLFKSMNTGDVIGRPTSGREASTIQDRGGGDDLSALVMLGKQARDVGFPSQSAPDVAPGSSY